MRKDISIQSFLAGLLLFGLCFLSMVAKLGVLVLIISHLFPGLIFGFLLIQNMVYQASVTMKAVFVLLSTIIYIACVFFVDVRHDDEIWVPVRLTIASSVGASLLVAAYHLLILKKFSLKKSLLLAFMLGFIASLSSAFSLFYVHQLNFKQEFLNNLCWAVTFSIFPIWYFLISWNIKRESGSVAKKGIAKIPSDE